MDDISLIKIYNVDSIKQLKQEVFTWAVSSSLQSGFCNDEKEAKELYEKNILRAFDCYLNKQHCFNIVLDKNSIIGKIWLMERTLDDSKISDLRISYIGLLPEYQKKGYAGKAFKLIEEYARQINHNKLSLNVFSHLPHAKKLYQKLGFFITRETKKNEFVVTSEMKKNIGSGYA